jgi:two-component system, OmpR family, copper resistance phosphate regulon response regulator CusR
MRILLIEDEPKLARSIKKGLEEHQIDVDFAQDGLLGKRMSQSSGYAVIISDVVMPGMNGIDLTRQIRDEGNRTPILLLTALGQMDDKVAGFDAGADDYLTKPFEFRELLLRVQALARRPVDSYQALPELRFADVVMDLQTREFYRAERKIPLTPKEFALMEYFLKNPMRVISKQEISEKVWNLDFDTGTNIIEVYVNFLRKKVDKDFDTKLIHTQFKNGYILKVERGLGG